MQAIVRQAREGLLRDCCQVVLVYSNRPAAPGLEKARQAGIHTICISSWKQDRNSYDRAMLAALEPHRLDYLVLAGYMRVLGPPLIRRYPNRIVNIHPADTSLHKGLGGYEWAWRQRLSVTAVTVHLVDEGLDTGPVLLKRQVDLRGASSLEQVEARGLAVEHQLYPRALHALFTGKLRAREPEPCAE